MDCFYGIDEDVIHMNLKGNAPHTESMHNHHRDSMHRQSMHQHHPPTSDLAQRFKDLAEETEEFRHALYKKVQLASKKKILDAGCGTGAITHDIASLTEGEIIGCDITSELLTYARKSVLHRNVTFVRANIRNLPFKDETFDLVVFTNVLTHTRNQQEALNEMARVTCKEGVVLATGEPDYGGDLYYPEDKAHFLFVNHLEKRGIDLYAGRKLRSLFKKAGLKPEIGIDTTSLDTMNKDNEELKRFLNHFWFTENFLSRMGWAEQEIKDYKEEQIELIEKRLSFRFTPFFYALGRKI